MRAPAKRCTPAAARWSVVVLVVSCGVVVTFPFVFGSEREARDYHNDVTRALPTLCVCPTEVHLRAPSGELVASSSAGVL